MDYNRLLMLAAVASRRSGLELSGQDIIVNVAGGFKISEPAGDLPLVLSMASSLYNCPLDSDVFAFGEVGLSGEIRGVSQAQRRITESARLGLTKCILPESCLEGLNIPEGMEIAGVKTLRQAINVGLTQNTARNRSDQSLLDPVSNPKEALNPS